MHRRRVTLSARATQLTERIGRGSILVRKARNVERRGVIATYDLHDHLLSNQRARRKFARNVSELRPVQQRVLADLERQDYAIVPFAELLPDAALRARVADDGAAFVKAILERLATAGGEARDEHKHYLVRRQVRVPSFLSTRLGSPAAFRTSCSISPTRTSVCGRSSSTSTTGTPTPFPADSERIQSQRWHRDFDDRHLLKAFLYLVDVDEETGPLEYVAGSARGSAGAAYIPWRTASPKYPSSEKFDENVPASDVRTFTAPAGTLILCNTSGFHRGGFATGKPRVLATATYCSPASLKSLTDWNYALSEEARHALSGPQLFAVPKAKEARSTKRSVSRPFLQNGHARLVRITATAMLMLFAIFVLLPEALGDRPYDPF